MTDPGPFAMGPPPGWRPPPPRPRPPADESTRAAALRHLRQVLARRGPACVCRHGSHVHRHADPSTSHCGLCGPDRCTSYRKAST